VACFGCGVDQRFGVVSGINTGPGLGIGVGVIWGGRVGSFGGVFGMGVGRYGFRSFGASDIAEKVHRQSVNNDLAEIRERLGVKDRRITLRDLEHYAGR